MLLISNVIMGALIVFVLLNFFTKLLAEKVFKKVLPPWTKTAITTVSLILSVLSFLNEKR